MIEDKNGRVKFYSYNKATKKLNSISDLFIKEEDNFARNLTFNFPSPSPSAPGGSLGIIDSTANQTSSEDIWSKLTYCATPGAYSKTINVSGEAGDVITFSFLLQD